MIFLCAETVLTGVSIIAAFGAAGLWLKASCVHIPDLLASNIDSAFQPIQRAAKFNAYAAGCAGVSAAMQSLLMILSFG